MKSIKILTILVLALGLFVCLPKAGRAEPMGTAFTYQGRLLDANTAADGLYDLQFTLYDAVSDGNAVGFNVRPDVDVIDGYFTAVLDFNSVFDGDARWLEIGVRPGNQNDPNVYTVLSPRQEITPTPYALYAKTAGGGGGGSSPWQVNGTSIYYNNGNVGIGTANPHGLLQVGEPFVVTSDEDVGISDAPPEYTPDAKLEITTGTSKDFLMISSDPNADGDVLIVKHNGNVGIGTTSPEEKLTLNDGTIKATTSAFTGRAIYGKASYNDQTNRNYGGHFEAAGGNGYGVYGFASNNGFSVANYGGYFKAAGSHDGTAGVYGEASNIEATHNYGGYFKAAGSMGYGVYGEATGNEGYGVYGKASNGGYGGYFESAIIGVQGYSVNGIGVLGQTSNADGYAGYFEGGRNFFEGNVGVGTTNPQSKLSVGGDGYSSCAICGFGYYGVYGTGSETGVLGDGGTYGVYGYSSIIGVYGCTGSAYVGTGVYGLGNTGIYGTGNTYGVYGLGGNYDFYAAGPGVDYGSSSSIRWKRDIRPIDEPLDKIMNLRGVYFNWDAEHGGGHDIGMVAEEVGMVLPEIVGYEENGIDAAGMDYSKLTPLLVEAVKALKTEVDQLQKENADLRNRVEAMEKMMTGGSGLQIGVK